MPTCGRKWSNSWPAAAHLGSGCDLTGTILGPYRLLRLIGRGGMGEVYSAEDSRLDRQVALKLLPALLTADQARVRRFHREARAASALNHPNIVTVHEFGESAGVHYIATELVEGRTLPEIVATEELSVPEVMANRRPDRRRASRGPCCGRGPQRYQAGKCDGPA